MNKIEVTKDLFKSKNMASFSYYASGNLYYNIVVFGSFYQFPISTIEKDEVVDSTKTELVPTIKLSSDLGNTNFYGEIKGSELNRWILKAIDSKEFIKLS